MNIAQSEKATTTITGVYANETKAPLAFILEDAGVDDFDTFINLFEDEGLRASALEIVIAEVVNGIRLNKAASKTNLEGDITSILTTIKSNKGDGPIDVISNHHRDLSIREARELISIIKKMGSAMIYNEDQYVEVLSSLSFKSFCFGYFYNK